MSITLYNKIVDEQIYNLNDYPIIKEQYQHNSNIYFYIEGNTHPISLTDFEKTYNIINNIVSKIQKLNLSPLEQIMYVYDLVRDRVYKEELITEPPYISRDLTSVLLGDRIVCVGFTNFFNQILENLGITSKKDHLKSIDSNEPNHVRNIVYVYDKKYNIEGNYLFDLTLDCKDNIDDNTYLNSYRYFAKTKKEMDRYYPKYQSITITKISNTPIDYKTLLEVLYNVRKIEHYEDKEKYPLNIETITIIAYNSHWLLKENDKEYFLNVTFNKLPYKTQNFQTEISKYYDETALEERINKSKVLTLKK